MTESEQYQLGELERILRLLSNALRRTIDGDPNAETTQDKRDTDAINRSYVAEAKALLAKHDSVTFTRENPRKPTPLGVGGMKARPT